MQRIRLTNNPKANLVRRHQHNFFFLEMASVTVYLQIFCPFTKLMLTSALSENGLGSIQKIFDIGTH